MAKTNSSEPIKESALVTHTPVGKLAASDLHKLFGYQLAQATITTTKVFLKEVGVPLDLRPVEFTLLTLIAENPGVSSAQLAKALAVTKPNITMWVDKLEARKLVQRSPSKTDKRSTDLRATTTGAKLAIQATDNLVRGEREAIQYLSAAERGMLIELLHKVARSR